MSEIPNRDREGDFQRVVITSKLEIPLFAWPVHCGFPSPAESYIERVCDLNDLCIYDKDATYFGIAEGDSMSGDRIREGDRFIFDASLTAQNGDIVVAQLNDEYTLKRIRFADTAVILEPSNPAYEPIYVQPEDKFRVVGVVTYVFFKPKRRKRHAGIVRRE